MILTKKEIEKEIEKGTIKITNFNKKHIGPASIDLTLSNEFRFFNNKKNKVILNEDADYKKETEYVKKDKYVLKPHEFVLGITKEKVTLPNNICAWIQGRSRFARFGLSIHITASFLQPGISNKQVLEIYNASDKNLVLEANTKICQIILDKTKGSASYQGRFKNQELK